jgi:hypothetical protein
VPDSVPINDPEQERRKNFTSPIKCWCGQIGSATWEGRAQLSPEGAGPGLLAVSSGFYLRGRKKDMLKMDVVCELCKRIVVDS